MFRSVFVSWLFISIFPAFSLLAEAGKPLLVIPGPRQAEADFPPWNDPLVDRIGYRVLQAIEEWGPPQEMAVNRGAEAVQDSIIFYYADHTYLYWWQNRLWQIRFDGRYKGEVMGIEMGLSRTDVVKRLGNPFNGTANDIIYQLPDRGFPVRLRLIFNNDRLVDFYLYRADF